uniref:Uncharacterized protein n=1 Tax=Escherichia coli TaxID=562 RepID=A0A6H0A030_ECOLX|nr:hypothetical protein [Escherichia coli]
MWLAYFVLVDVSAKYVLREARQCRCGIVKNITFAVGGADERNVQQTCVLIPLLRILCRFHVYWCWLK